MPSCVISTPALLLRCVDTPGGGNTGVAESALGAANIDDELKRTPSTPTLLGVAMEVQGVFVSVVVAVGACIILGVAGCASAAAAAVAADAGR